MVWLLGGRIEFVREAKRPQPQLLAVLNVYGSIEQIHSLRLLFQWVDGEVVFERLYHLIEGPVDQWIDSVLEEVKWLGPNIKIVLIDNPLDIEYCSCCGKSLANIINSDAAQMPSTPDWSRSIGSIYINPDRPSLAISISYENMIILNTSVHKCGNYLHLISDSFEERTPIRATPSVRSQISKLVYRFLKEWRVNRVLIGTGNHDTPDVIKQLDLPIVWER